MTKATVHSPAGVPTEMHTTQVSEVMHPGIVACAPTASLAEVARIMTSRRVHCVAVAHAPGPGRDPVIDGIVSASGLLRWAPGSSAHTPVGSIAAGPVVTVAP